MNRAWTGARLGGGRARVHIAQRRPPRKRPAPLGSAAPVFISVFPNGRKNGTGGFRREKNSSKNFQTFFGGENAGRSRRNPAKSTRPEKKRHANAARETLRNALESRIRRVQSTSGYLHQNENEKPYRRIERFKPKSHAPLETCERPYNRGRVVQIGFATQRARTPPGRAQSSGERTRTAQ